MNKGDQVLVKATVWTEYGPGYEDELVHQPTRWSGPDLRRIKSLRRERWAQPRHGLLVGYSYLATGCGYGSAALSASWDEDSPALREDRRHRVWVVEPLDNNRYIKPWHCLEEDLELVTPHGEQEVA